MLLEKLVLEAILNQKRECPSGEPCQDECGAGECEREQGHGHKEDEVVLSVFSYDEVSTIDCLLRVRGVGGQLQEEADEAISRFIQALEN